MVNEAGLCLDVHWDDHTNNGGNVQVWECNGQINQKWRYEGSSNALVNGGGLCLDVEWHFRRENGGNVQVWECNGQKNQRWHFE